MLRIKHAFGLLFLALFAVFAACVYVLVGSNIDTLLFKQYEQKLKTLDDTLRFGLLRELNSSNIKDFAAQTRADFIIVHNGGVNFRDYGEGRAAENAEKIGQGELENGSNAEILDENSSKFNENAEFDSENLGEKSKNAEFPSEFKGENSSNAEFNAEFLDKNSNEFSPNTEFSGENLAKNSKNADFSTNFDENLPYTKQGRAFSSLSNAQDFLYTLPNSAFFDSQIHFTELGGKKALYKVYFYEGYRYIIVVYPRILELKGYWSKVFGAFAACVVLFFAFLQLFAGRLNASFQKILLFLQKIDKKDSVMLDAPLFKELSQLNEMLYKSKNELLKRQKLAKKRSRKVSLKNTQLSSVISAISHELKNPLSVIELGVSSLKERGIDEKTRLLMLTKIHEQCAKLDTLTNKLNLVFNLNEQAVQKREFDIFSLCEKIASNPIFTRVRLRGKPCVVLADELLIEQVLINLLTNALKYSKKEVSLSVKPLKNAVRVSVKDRGIGIEGDKLKLITKKFYKIDPASENSFGIGLFLVKKILALHASTLQIESEPKKGSEFSFVLAV